MQKILIKKCLMKNSLMEKVLTKKILMKKIKNKKPDKIYIYIFFLYIKMTNNYFQKNKKNFQKETRERYQNLSKEEKDKKR